MNINNNLMVLLISNGFLVFYIINVLIGGL